MNVYQWYFRGRCRGAFCVLFVLVSAGSMFFWHKDGMAAGLILLKGSTAFQRNFDTVLLLPDGFPLVSQDVMNACRQISRREADLLFYDITKKKCDRFENLTVGNRPEPGDSVLSEGRRHYGLTISGLLDEGYLVFFDAASGTASCVPPIARKGCPSLAGSGNLPPTANAGDDTTYEAASSLGASVVLNGAGSTDPDGDPLTYAWSGSFGTATGVSPTVTLGLGTHAIALDVTDSKGATGKDTVEISVIDTTPPSVAWTSTPYPNVAGWNNADVTVAFTATDSVSAGTCSPASVIVNTEGAGQVASTVCTDGSGNQAAANTTVNTDKTPPAISFGGSCPATAGLDTTVEVTVSVSDVLSGVAFQSVPNGSSMLDTSSVGPKTFTVTAKDNADNQGSNACLYTVAYDFDGFLPPLENPPAVNKGKAGRVIPVKWQIPDGRGGYISDLSVVRSIQFQQVSCQTYSDINEIPLDAEISGSSGLHYDAADNQFVYNWQTVKSGAGKCFVMILKLNDGSEHRANLSLQ